MGQLKFRASKQTDLGFRAVLTRPPTQRPRLSPQFSPPSSQADVLWLLPLHRAPLRDLLAWVCLESLTPSLKPQLPGTSVVMREKAGHVGGWGLGRTGLGGTGAPGGLMGRCCPIPRVLAGGCTQPTLLALAISARPHSPKVSLCQVSRKESCWHYRIPSKVEAGWGLCVHIPCVSVCPDPLFQGTRNTLGLYTVPDLACRFLGNFCNHMGHRSRSAASEGLSGTFS